MKKLNNLSVGAGNTPLSIACLLTVDCGCPKSPDPLHCANKRTRPASSDSHAKTILLHHNKSMTGRQVSRTMAIMKDMLDRSGHLPEHEFASGEAIVREGSAADGIWILVSGALQVRKGDVLVNTINQPGAMIGEISVLLNTFHGATVETTAPSCLRYAADGEAFLASDPEISRLVAMGLAERLNFVTTYLADLKHQYGDAPGLAMVSDVLIQLAQRQAPLARPGSARDPNPDY